jgi:hypothetical protein
MTDKNMADVADKAVSELGRLADAFQKVAPGLWRSMVDYEFTYAIVSIGACLLFTMASAAVVLAAYRMYQKAKDGDETACATIGVLALIVFATSLFVTAVNLPSNIATIRAPEAEAAHVILSSMRPQ